MRARVVAPARLHLGFIDLGGEAGRRYGSIGLALERPRWVVEAAPARGRPEAVAPDPAVEAALARIAPILPGRVRVRVLEAIPRHAGLGSGTQLALAVGLAAARAQGRAVTLADLAHALARGRRSGVGLAVFQGGGFVVDAGRRDQAPEELPPVVLRHPVPPEWRVVLACPPGEPGLSGPAEERVFETLPPMSADRVGRICRLVLMQAAPAVVTDDLAAFGAAVTEVQRLVGEHFAPYQGGVYASPAGKRAVELALGLGAAGAGQSSWGPTVFALTRGDAAAAALADALRAELGPEASVTWTRFRNRGASGRVRA